MRKTDRCQAGSFASRLSLGAISICTLAVFAIACGSSTEATPSTVTGVWGGRVNYLTPNDSFTFYFSQQDAEGVEGWGIFYSGSGSRVTNRLIGGGIITAGQLTMAFGDLDQTGTFPAGALYNLSGPLRNGQVNAVFEAGPNSYPVTLRPARPNASELVGTWVLTSSTGTPAPAGLLDTIIANADGRAMRHREGDYSFGTIAMWSKRGSYMVVDHELSELKTDSLLIQGTELQRTQATVGGARVDHYTRVSTSANLP
jgi:hypothetical protein